MIDIVWVEVRAKGYKYPDNLGLLVEVSESEEEGKEKVDRHPFLAEVEEMNYPLSREYWSRRRRMMM